MEYINTPPEITSGITMHRLKSLLLALFLTVFALLNPVSALAAPYGECAYGEGTYNEGGCSTTSGTSGSGSSNSGSSDPSAPSCTAVAPGSAPWLYGAMAQDGDSILLYFTDAGDPVDSYALEFGSESGNYQWGTTNIGGKGLRTYLVQSLQPNTTYYFRVRGGNGCATGSWSNEISAKTKGLISFNQFAFTQSELASAPLTTDGEAVSEGSSAAGEAGSESDKALDSYIVNVNVFGQDQNPVGGATVTIHSDPQEAITDENGKVRFESVEPGQHRVLVAYDGYEGEQSIFLAGDSKEFTLNITLEMKNILMSRLFIPIVGGMGLVIALLSFFLLRPRLSKV